MHHPDYLIAPGEIRIAADRLYHRDHYWIVLDWPHQGRCRFGLSAYVCRPGIEVYFIENLAQPGQKLAEGELLGTVETEKAVVSIYSPLSCKVAAINLAVLQDPNLISFDNYNAWIIEVEAGAVPKLLSPEEYLQYLQTLPPPQCLTAFSQS